MPAGRYQNYYWTHNIIAFFDLANYHNHLFGVCKGYIRIVIINESGSKHNTKAEALKIVKWLNHLYNCTTDWL